VCKQRAIPLPLQEIGANDTTVAIEVVGIRCRDVFAGIGHHACLESSTAQRILEGKVFVSQFSTSKGVTQPLSF
jgi:hypothetical protein